MTGISVRCVVARFEGGRGRRVRGLFVGQRDVELFN